MTERTCPFCGEPIAVVTIEGNPIPLCDRESVDVFFVVNENKYERAVSGYRADHRAVCKVLVESKWKAKYLEVERLIAAEATFKTERVPIVPHDPVCPDCGCPVARHVFQGGEATCSHLTCPNTCPNLKGGR